MGRFRRTPISDNGSHQRGRQAWILHSGADSNEWSRQVLMGVAQFSEDVGGWRFDLPTPKKSGEVVPRRSWHGDGVICRLTSDRLEARLLELGKPCVKCVVAGRAYVADSESCVVGAGLCTDGDRVLSSAAVSEFWVRWLLAIAGLFGRNSTYDYRDPGRRRLRITCLSISRGLRGFSRPGR